MFEIQLMYSTIMLYKKQLENITGQSRKITRESKLPEKAHTGMRIWPLRRFIGYAYEDFILTFVIVHKL